jgi:GDP-L-fucose synthase
VAAAKVGGILANATYPADFISENLGIALNVVRSAHRWKTGRLLFLGSSCIYPREAPQPMPEEALLSAPLETTNEAYAVAKIAGLKLCQHYRAQYGDLFHSAMPTNLYGPGDNYHAENSHVIPAMILRFHEAKEAGLSEVAIWGTGTPRREFLHVDDLADAMMHLLDLRDPPDWINVGSGIDIPIAGLAELVKAAVGYEGKITLDRSKPDGPSRKLLDVSRLFATGWRPAIGLEEGLKRTYCDFLKEREESVLRVG